MTEKDLEKALIRAEKLLKDVQKTAESQQPEEGGTFDELMRFMVKSMLKCLKESVSKLQSKYTPKEEKARLRYAIPYQVNTLLALVKAAGEYLELELGDQETRELLKGAKRTALTARKFMKAHGDQV